MELFDNVFNRIGVYDKFFFSIKAVLIYPTLDDLKEKNPTLFERWKYLSETKYNQKIVDVRPVPAIIGNENDKLQLIQNNVYEEKAVYYPEFTRIAAITYATLYLEDGKPKRYFKKITNEDECLVIATFLEILQSLSTEGNNSSPKHFAPLCGYNLITYDIPLFIKRFLLYRDKFENNTLPLIIKNCLVSKPWEANVIDAVNVWKFNGIDHTPLMLIADHLGLKRTVELDSLQDISKEYWKLVKDTPDKALDYLSLQSATQTNIVIQLMNELSQL